MAQSVIHLTQSQYYSPIFNAAVFDGPVRIYFAQHQESLALKIYFKIQQYFQAAYPNFRKNFKHHGQTIFVMIYPNSESFHAGFPGESAPMRVVSEVLGQDHVIGVCGPLEEKDYEAVFEKVKVILGDLGLSQEPVAQSI